MTRPVRALLALVLAAMAGGALSRAPKPPPPPSGELVLDIADPVISVKIGDVPLRLRVGLEQKKLIELNPDAADRIAASPPSKEFRFEPGFEAQVGRETLTGIEAAAPIRINDRDMLVLIASHGRTCCAGVDGEIGVTLLPYARIRFVRRDAAPAPRSADFLIEDNDEQGPETPVAIGAERLFVQFSLSRAETVATSSAGVILARAYGGQLVPGGASTIAAFGIARPTRTLRLARPARLAGFAFDRLPVRMADFGGRLDFPADPSEPEDIVVQKKLAEQAAWPVVLIGRDRLDRCSEISFDMIAQKLTLYCDFGESD